MFAELLIHAQLHNDKNAKLQILECFTPKINSSLHQTNFEYREDLKQDLYVSILEVIQRFE